MVDNQIDQVIEETSSDHSLFKDFHEWQVETTLPIRLDVACALTYALGVPGSLFFLIKEHRNDLVRFNAWQSLIFFLPIFIITLILMPIGKWWRWLVLSQIALASYLSFMAYKRSASMQVFRLPIVSYYAELFLQSE